MPDNVILEFLQKYWAIVASAVGAVVYFASTNNNTGYNTRSIDKEVEDRKAGDEALRKEIFKVEERLMARQDAEARNVNARFDDLKADVKQANNNITELLKRNGK